MLRSIEFAHIQCNLLHLDIRPNNLICLENGDWVLIDWGAAQRCESTNGQKHVPLREYAGCVTTAADCLLRALAAEDDGDSTIVPVSRATDIISLLRTVFLLTNHISPFKKSKLSECRNCGDFDGVVDWWKAHLPLLYTNFEMKINEMFVIGGDIYSAMKCFLESNIPAVL